MMAQYCFFLAHLHGRIFFWTGAIFAKWNLISLENSTEDISTFDQFLFLNTSNKTIGIPTGFPGLTSLLSWLCSRYQYYFPVEGAFLISAMLMRPVAYFYSLIEKGDKFSLIALLVILSDIYFSETLGWHEIKQWQCTIFILSLTMTVLRVLYWLAQTSIDNGNPIFFLALTLSFGVILSAYCKEYVNDYVVLSKI